MKLLFKIAAASGSGFFIISAALFLILISQDNTMDAKKELNTLQPDIRYLNPNIQEVKRQFSMNRNEFSDFYSIANRKIDSSIEDFNITKKNVAGSSKKMPQSFLNRAQKIHCSRKGRNWL